jgi:hypothetical protein
LGSERKRRYSSPPSRLYDSPQRRYTPDRSRGNSPDRNRRFSPDRRKYSPERRYSPEREKRYSPENKRNSSDGIRNSSLRISQPSDSKPELKQNLNPLEIFRIQTEKQETKFQLDVKRIFHYFHEYIELELNELIPALVDDLWGENSSQERTNKKRDEIWEYIFDKHIKEDEYFKNLQFKAHFKTGMEKLFRQKWENTKNRFCKT